MVIEIDFNSDEAIYMQITNQIIMGIATSRLHEGDALPSVRQLASIAGINMHTVNKAYALLRQEGFVTIDRRKGAVISIDADKVRALEEMKQNLTVAMAWGCCKNVTREEVHQLVDEIFDAYLSRPGVRQPILTQYCDGRQVSCEGWMTKPKEGMSQGQSPGEPYFTRFSGAFIM